MISIYTTQLNILNNLARSRANLQRGRSHFGNGYRHQFRIHFMVIILAFAIITRVFIQNFKSIHPSIDVTCVFEFQIGSVSSFSSFLYYTCVLSQSNDCRILFKLYCLMYYIKSNFKTFFECLFPAEQQLVVDSKTV